jgi:hypothetical protein
LSGDGTCRRFDVVARSKVGRKKGAVGNVGTMGNMNTMTQHRSPRAASCGGGAALDAWTTLPGGGGGTAVSGTSDGATSALFNECTLEVPLDPNEVYVCFVRCPGFVPTTSEPFRVTAPPRRPRKPDSSNLSAPLLPSSASTSSSRWGGGKNVTRGEGRTQEIHGARGVQIRRFEANMTIDINPIMHEVCLRVRDFAAFSGTRIAFLRN